MKRKEILNPATWRSEDYSENVESKFETVEEMSAAAYTRLNLLKALYRTKLGYSSAGALPVEQI